VNDGIAVEIIHGGQEAILEFLLGCDADVAQDGAGEFGKEALDEIEPRAVLSLDFSNSSSLWRHLKPATGVFRGTKDKLDRVGAL
jgi:hypothetical protein